MESSAIYEIEDVMEIIPPQVPPGDLSSGETEEPPASASLPDPPMSRTSFTFGTVARAVELVAVDDIVPYDGIPDYREPTSAELPIVVVTPRGKFCIEGQNLIRAAASDGAREILCEIEVMEEHSDVELSLRKTASRIATRGGLASYPEKVRNVTAAKRQLEASGMDLRVFGHGGRRFGQGFVNEPQADIKHILALRFTRKPKTIVNYLTHGEDLSVDVLELLVERDVQRQFFQKYQAKKQHLIKELKKKGVSEQDRVEQVSALMLGSLAEYLSRQQEVHQDSGQEQPNVPAPQSGTPEAPASAPGSQGNAPLQATLQDEEEQGDAASESEDEGVLSDEVGDDQEPSEHPQTMTREDVDEAILAVAERLGDLPNLELSRVELIDSIRDEIDALTQLVQQLDQLQD